MKQFLTMLFVCGAAFAQTKSTTAAKKAAAPARNILVPSTLKARAPETFKAKFTTTQGDIVIQVTRAWAPLGADRFYNLVRGGFFTNATFFRVIPGFMAQFGLSADPKVTAVWSTETLKDDPVKESNKRGFISFATSGPDSRTTQMFINFADNARLDGMGFSPFGEVVEGMDVVDKLYSGYGENPPTTQGSITQLGKPWIDKNMPKADSIKIASIVPTVPPAATATKSTTKSTTTTKAATKSTTSTSKQ
jgi:peptidyl-prolyl cis-trans isomerase A (cyclophilin A)